MKVFTLDKNKKPLMPMHPARARKLLRAGRAAVVSRAPFTIRLRDRLAEHSQIQPVRLKFDPGAKITGIALVREAGSTGHVLHLAELHHRPGIKGRLDSRRAFRRRRRNKNLRYRPARWGHRTKPRGWLPPSLRARVDGVKVWAQKYMRLVPVSAISVETVRFDTQKLQNPEISGIEYQQGTLAGYEIKEYVLEKWGRKCVYCDAENVILEIEHVRPKSRGGSNRPSNLVLACVPCNKAKSNRRVEEFLADQPARLDRIKKHLKQPLRYAAIATATRWAIWNKLNDLGLLVEMGTGGRTKWNRTRRGLPKTHALDAVCVGASTPDRLTGTGQQTLAIRAVGRGRYQRTTLNKYGFPRGYLSRKKSYQGFKTGDTVRLTVPQESRSKFKGLSAVGNVVIRHSGSFGLKVDGKKIVGGISWRYFTLIAKSAGYEFSVKV